MDTKLLMGVPRMAIVDSYHDKDSSHLVFMLCARDAMRLEILPRAAMILL